MEPQRGIQGGPAATGLGTGSQQSSPPSACGPLAVWPGGHGCCGQPTSLAPPGRRTAAPAARLRAAAASRNEPRVLSSTVCQTGMNVISQTARWPLSTGLAGCARVGDTDELDPEHLPVFQVRGPGDVVVQHPPGASRQPQLQLADHLDRHIAGGPAAPRQPRRLCVCALHVRASASSPPGQPSASVATSRATEAASPSAPSSTRVPSGRSVNASLRVTATAAQRTQGHTAGSASTPGPPPLVAGYHPPPAAAAACPSPGQAAHTPPTHGRWSVPARSPSQPAAPQQPPPSTHGTTPPTTAHRRSWS